MKLNSVVFLNRNGLPGAGAGEGGGAASRVSLFLGNQRLNLLADTGKDYHSLKYLAHRKIPHVPLSQTKPTVRGRHMWRADNGRETPRQMARRYHGETRCFDGMKSDEYEQEVLGRWVTDSLIFQYSTKPKATEEGTKGKPRFTHTKRLL